MTEIRKKQLVTALSILSLAGIPVAIYLVWIGVTSAFGGAYAAINAGVLAAIFYLYRGML